MERVPTVATGCRAAQGSASKLVARCFEWQKSFLHFQKAALAGMAFLSERVRFGMKAKRNSQQVRRETRRASPRLWHSDVPGPFWNGTRRVGVSQIKAYCRTLAREFHPRKIILFGSYAYGTPTKDSDVDLLVIMPH